MVQSGYFKVHFTEGEYVFPSDVKIQELQREEVAALLSGPARSGCRTAVKAVCVCGLFFAVSVFWLRDTIFIWAGGIVFLGVAGLLINEILKYRCALDMAANPQRLLWAHPTAWTKDPNDRNSEATFATFHSESGRSLEVWMRSETRTALFAWFKQQNPAVRLTGSPPR